MADGDLAKARRPAVHTQAAGSAPHRGARPRSVRCRRPLARLVRVAGAARLRSGLLLGDPGQSPLRHPRPGVDRDRRRVSDRPDAVSGVDQGRLPPRALLRPVRAAPHRARLPAAHVRALRRAGCAWCAALGGAARVEAGCDPRGLFRDLGLVSAPARGTLGGARGAGAGAVRRRRRRARRRVAAVHDVGVPARRAGGRRAHSRPARVRRRAPRAAPLRDRTASGLFGELGPSLAGRSSGRDPRDRRTGEAQGIAPRRVGAEPAAGGADRWRHRGPTRLLRTAGPDRPGVAARTERPAAVLVVRAHPSAADPAGRACRTRLPQTPARLSADGGDGLAGRRAPRLRTQRGRIRGRATTRLGGDRGPARSARGTGGSERVAALAEARPGAARRSVSSRARGRARDARCRGTDDPRDRHHDEERAAPPEAFDGQPESAHHLRAARSSLPRERPRAGGRADLSVSG